MATNTIRHTVTLNAAADNAMRESAKGMYRAQQIEKNQVVLVYQLAVRVLTGNATITGMDIRGMDGEDCVKVLFHTNSLNAAASVMHLVNVYHKVANYVEGFRD